jgi:hypothetical protein
MSGPRLILQVEQKIPDLDGDDQEESLIVSKYRIDCKTNQKHRYCAAGGEGSIRKTGVAEYWEERSGKFTLKLSSGKQLSDLTLSADLEGAKVHGIWKEDLDKGGHGADYFKQMWRKDFFIHTDKNHGFFAQYYRENYRYYIFGGMTKTYCMHYGLTSAGYTFPSYKKGDRVYDGYGQEGEIIGFQLGLGILGNEEDPAPVIPALAWLGVYATIKLPDGKIEGQRLIDLAPITK